MAYLNSSGEIENIYTSWASIWQLRLLGAHIYYHQLLLNQKRGRKAMRCRRFIMYPIELSQFSRWLKHLGFKKRSGHPFYSCHGGQVATGHCQVINVRPQSWNRHFDRLWIEKKIGSRISRRSALGIVKWMMMMSSHTHSASGVTYELWNPKVAPSDKRACLAAYFYRLSPSLR